jgi:hypothetical protein
VYVSFIERCVFGIHDLARLALEEAITDINVLLSKK